jgi:hypothetical protein
MAVGPPIRKIIQLLVSRNTLIALTDTSEIWVLHGFDSLPTGTDARALQWQRLSLELPAVSAEVIPQSSW